MPNLRKLKLLRRIKVMRGRRDMWQSRLVFWVGAIAIGLVSVAFAKASDWASDAFHHVTHAGPYAFLIPLALTPAGFALSAWLAFRYFPNSQGSGIPQAIAARHFHDAESRNFLLSLKLAAAKIVLTIFGIFCGGSIGREGPTVQVGASIMLQAARIGGVVQARGLILAGSAAGIAAAFNTPLAGIVFAIEEMSRNFEIRANGAVLTAVILSGLAALGLLGDYNTYFGSTHDVMNGMKDWWLVLLCGIGGGAFGALFSTAVLRLTIRLKRWRQAAPVPRLIAIAAGFGFLVALIGIVSGGLTFGTGYNQARAALQGTPLPPLFFVEKLAATFLCTMSGIPAASSRRRSPWEPASARPSASSWARMQASRPFSAWRDTLRASSRPDDGLCHHSRNDRQPPERHRAHGHRHARLHHLAPHQPRTALSRSVARLHGRHDPPPAQSGARRGHGDRKNRLTREFT